MFGILKRIGAMQRLQRELVAAFEGARLRFHRPEFSLAGSSPEGGTGDGCRSDGGALRHWD